MTEGDVLHDLPAIAAFLGITRRQAKHWHESGVIPTFKVGKSVCALRSALSQRLRELSTTAQASQKPQEPRK